MTTATEDAQAQSKALLAAIAEQGTRGAQYYEQAAQQAQAQKQSAVQAALDRAQGGPGASATPAALTTQLAGQAAQTGDQRAADVAQAAAYQQQDQQALSSANDTYMNQVQAAIPIVGAKINAQAAQQARDNALQRQLADLQLQQSQLGLESTKVSLEGQREQNAANRAAAAAAAARAAQPQQMSVAEQRYMDDQALQEHQSAVQRMAASSGQVGSAFNFIVGDPDNGSLEAALADLDNSLQPAAFSPWGPIPSPFEQRFPDADPNAVRALIIAYYSPPGSGGQSAPNVAAIPGVGAVARRS